MGERFPRKFSYLPTNATGNSDFHILFSDLSDLIPNTTNGNILYSSNVKDLSLIFPYYKIKIIVMLSSSVLTDTCDK